MGEHQQQYKFEFTDNLGKEHSGTAVLDSDKEAVEYFRSLENNSGIRMQSLERNSRQIWGRVT
jgi:hypothetical protein